MSNSFSLLILSSRQRLKILLFIAAVLVLTFQYVVPVRAAETPIFPVIGSAHFSNDFYASRPSGQHSATDIMAAKHSPIVAPVSGRVAYVVSPQASWGYSVGIRDDAGYQYNFIHMNNDTPGTNDNAGGEMYAYAPDMKVNNRVERGQLLGYVGDSGNSGGVSHLHFEIETPDGEKINPYEHLLRWDVIPTPALYPPLASETLPYWVAFGGALNLAMGDFNGDGQSETVTAPGAGGGPHIKTYSNANGFLGEFFAYDPNFRGGVDVATGDLNGDGVDEIITGPGAGGGPWVRVFNTNAQLLSQFAAYDPAFTGGIRVAAGDTDGDGVDEIITGPGATGGPWVRVFNAQAQVVGEFPAYDVNFLGGIDVATADTVDSTAKEIITGPGGGGGPWVRIFKQQGTLVKEFPVYDQRYTGGIRVSGGNVKSNSAKDEIMTIPAEYGESRVRLMANTGANITDYPYLETWWKGYYDVAAGNNSSRLGTGVNRRASMRNGPN